MVGLFGLANCSLVSWEVSNGLSKLELEKYLIRTNTYMYLRSKEPDFQSRHKEIYNLDFLKKNTKRKLLNVIHFLTPKNIYKY